MLSNASVNHKWVMRAKLWDDYKAGYLRTPEIAIAGEEGETVDTVDLEAVKDIAPLPAQEEPRLTVVPSQRSIAAETLADAAMQLESARVRYEKIETALEKARAEMVERLTAFDEAVEEIRRPHYTRREYEDVS